MINYDLLRILGGNKGTLLVVKPDEFICTSLKPVI